MTLRLRLTLFYTLLVTLVLSASGLGLYLLLSRSLHASLDRSLQEAADLVATLVENEDDVLEFETAKDDLPQLRVGLVALLIGSNGERMDSLGRVPEALPVISNGFSSWDDWRMLAEPLPGGSLVVLRDAESVQDSLESFADSFLLLAPITVIIAFVLGYALAARALRPIARLTRDAYDLAQRRAWRETLPEPRRKDELWRLSRATNTLLTALAEVIETERRFTADAAHELRTPLTVLRGRLEQALEHAGDAKSHKALEQARTASDDLLKLTETLLLLARAEAGQGMEAQPVAFDEVVFESADRLRPRFVVKGLALRLELDDDPLWVRGDRVALELLVRNLLDNALKFTASGSVCLAVHAAQGQATLVVADSGPGFPEGSLPHLFERFYQADIAYRRTGSGLGLALAQSIARWHGGELKAENRADGGARLSLGLPLHQPDALS